MIVVIFRSRLRPEHAVEYQQIAERIDALAEATPGFLGIRSYVASNGERVSLSCFTSLEAVQQWREHPDHLDAQRLGREKFYSEFSVQICEQLRCYNFTSEDQMQ